MSTAEGLPGIGELAVLSIFNSEYLIVLAYQSDPLVLEHAHKLIGRARAVQAPEHGGTMIETRSLSKRYGRRWALVDVGEPG